MLPFNTALATLRSSADTFVSPLIVFTTAAAVSPAFSGATWAASKYYEAKLPKVIHDASVRPQKHTFFVTGEVASGRRQLGQDIWEATNLDHLWLGEISERSLGGSGRKEIRKLGQL